MWQLEYFVFIMRYRKVLPNQRPIAGKILFPHIFNNFFQVPERNPLKALRKLFGVELKKISDLENRLPSDSTNKRNLKKKGILVYLGSDNKIYTIQKGY